MKTQNKILISVMGLAALATLPACEKTDRSFSLLDDGSHFQQAASYETRKIDVLWVIDNSGSMATSQANLTANFSSFISQFQGKGYDFHMAVTGSDAWRAASQSNDISKGILASARGGAIRFRTNQTPSTPDACTGTQATNPSMNPLQLISDTGTAIMDAATPNLNAAFVSSATQGICGTGDERPFASIKQFLAFTGSNVPVGVIGNDSFRREGAFLSVIIVSDEDDFSANTTSPIYGDYNEEAPGNDPNLHPLVLTAPSPADPLDIYHLYNDPRLDTVQSYKDNLDSVMGSTDNYSVNTIAILDTACRTTLNNNVGGRRLGRRYAALADMTNGVKASLCGDFAASLEEIAKKTLKLTAKFKLGREPDPTTIKVVVDGVTIPEDPGHGWTYNAADWSITFSDPVVPAQGANVQVFFTPLRADN
jgi:hypothetical protein